MTHRHNAWRYSIIGETQYEGILVEAGGRVKLIKYWLELFKVFISVKE